MAIDKAIDSSKLDREMLATANAIREKGKTEAVIPWEDETGYAAPILALKGGADLNFSVVAYASEDELPETADENTIAVITSNEITSWTFSATEPENPEEGMVWFTTDTSSTVEFNALKENSISVYPLHAKQYDGSAWVDMHAKSYQNGEWAEWVTYLYKAPNEYTDLTGGWTVDGFKWNNVPIANPIKTDEGMKLNGVTNVSYSAVVTAQKVDLTRFSLLNIHLITYGINVNVRLTQNSSNISDSASGFYGEYNLTVVDGKATLSLSGITGAFHIVIMGADDSNPTITEVYLE